MSLHRFITVCLSVLLCSQALAQSQSMGTELSTLAQKLAAEVSSHGKKKVAVIDFTDLEGNASELGRYIAEQLTVNLVMGKKDFAVLDRANLKSILAEHKLTATGLVNPDNAKKLGQFAGVDALILGNIVPMDTNVQITAKIITTDTAEIVGAARATFKSDAIVQKLLDKLAGETTANGGAADLSDDSPKVTKKFGDLRVELLSLKAIEGGQYQLTMSFVNQNKSKTIWVSMNSNNGMGLRGGLTDAKGFKYYGDWSGASGIVFSYIARYSYGPRGGFSPATEIKPGDSITATLNFRPFDGQAHTAQGVCNVQLEILLGHNLDTPSPNATVENLVAKMMAN